MPIFDPAIFDPNIFEASYQVVTSSIWTKPIYPQKTQIQYKINPQLLLLIKQYLELKLNDDANT